MFEELLDFIGHERLESTAREFHWPQKATYVIVNEDGSYRTMDCKKAWFNTRIRGMDFYSRIVTMNKPIKSKSIYTNNYLSFASKKRVDDKDIDNYFNILNIPADREWIPKWIKENLEHICQENPGLVRIFFPGTREEYRELGLKNWWEKSISFTPFSKELGVPICFTYNPKKAAAKTWRNIYLVDRKKCLEIKLLYDFFTSIGRRGNTLIYFYPNGFYACDSKTPPCFTIDDCIFMRIGFDQRGQLIIKEYEYLGYYNPFFDKHKKVIRIGNITDIV